MKSSWNKDQLFSSKSVEWSTPEWLFDALDMKFAFQLDVCASERNAKVDLWIDEDSNALEVEWVGFMENPLPSMAVWMNPPWGREVGKFVEKAYEQCRKHRLVVCCLLPASTDTRWWRDWVWKAGTVQLITGRLHFVREDGHTGPCPKGAAIVTFYPWHSGSPKVSLLAREDM